MSEHPVGELLFWGRSEWWQERGDIGVSRTQLIDRWADRAELGDIDRSRFTDALGAWSSVLARQPWVHSAIGAPAAMFASTGINTVHHDSETWLRVSWMWGFIGDRLARYVVGFINEVHRHRPVVGTLYSSTVREAARSVHKNVREAMVADDVLATDESLAEFLDEPGRRRRRDLGVAALAYATRLGDIAVKTEDPVLTDAVTAALSDLQGTFGIDVPDLGAQQVPVADRRVEPADIFWDQVTTGDSTADAFFDESAKRAIETIEKKLIDGVTVTPLHARRIYQLKKKSVAIEHRRPRANSEAPSDTPILEILTGAGSEVGERAARQRNVLAEARTILLSFPITPAKTDKLEPVAVVDFWEKNVAVAVLDGDAELTNRLGAMKRFVIDRWSQVEGTPIGAVCADEHHAAALVRAMVHIALARALGDLAEFSEWIGRSPTQTWAERFRAVTAVFDRCRAMEPQDIYDDPKKGDLS